MCEVAYPGHLGFPGNVEVGHDRVAHVDGEERFAFAEELAPSGAGPERNHQRDNREAVAVGHIEGAGLEGSERGVEAPAAAFGEQVYPLFVGMQFVHRLVEGPESAELFRDGDTADGLHQEAVLAAEGLGVHGDPGPAVAHRLQHANHIPTVDVVADGHHPVGEEFAVPAYLFATFYLDSEADPVCREGHQPRDEVYQEMPYPELQGFVEIGVGLVELDVLEFPAYGSHLHERVVTGEFLRRFRDVHLFPHLEVPVCRSKC